YPGAEGLAARDGKLGGLLRGLAGRLREPAVIPNLVYRDGSPYELLRVARHSELAEVNRFDVQPAVKARDPNFERLDGHPRRCQVEAAVLSYIFFSLVEGHLPRHGVFF